MAHSSTVVWAEWQEKEKKYSAASNPMTHWDLFGIAADEATLERLCDKVIDLMTELRNLNSDETPSSTKITQITIDFLAR